MLAAPLIAGQLAGVLMTFVDTVMAGRLSPEALASVAAGAAIWHTVMLAGMGVLMAVSPSVAQLEGAGRQREIAPLVRQALWIAGGLTLATGVVYLGAAPLLTALELDPALHPTILGYLRALLWGAAPMYAFLALRFLCEGMEISRPVMYFGFVGLAVNVVANSVLIYGRLGFPALGAVGCGYATSAVWWTELAGLIIYIRYHPRLRPLRLFERFEWPRAEVLGGLLRLGLPIGFSFFVEVSMFAGVALLMGTISTAAVAGHQVAINVASITFMVPLGISLATTVRVGNALGRGDLVATRRAGWIGLLLMLATQLVSATVLLTLPRQIAAIYSRDAALVAIAAELLILAAIFQLSDGLQVVAAGALRGLKDTRGPMIVTVVAYWLFGLPFGYWLGFHRGLGPRGLWIGFIGGLTVAGVLLTIRFAQLSSGLTGGQSKARLLGPMLACLLALSLPLSAEESTTDRLRIYTRVPGVHQVSFEDLLTAGLEVETVPSARLALSNRGQEVALWIADGGDGALGPGDHFEFVASRLPGTESHFHEFSLDNVYWLSFPEGGGSRMHAGQTVRAGESDASAAPAWRRRLHLERDRLLIRLAADAVESEEPEQWFWHKLTHLDRQPLEIPLELPGLAVGESDAVRFVAHFRALSSQREAARTALPDHELHFSVGGRQLEPAFWDGKQAHLVTWPPWPANELGGESLAMSLKIPSRRPAGVSDPLVDVVMLNWIEIDYPHTGAVGGGQVELWPEPEAPLRLLSTTGKGFVVYGASGERTTVAAAAAAFGEALDGEAGGAQWVVPDGALLAPERIEVDRPSTLAASDRQADYLMITHRRLLDSARELAELHRAAGLSVELVDVQDIYDEFGHGIVHPRAIKAFIAHAFHSWQSPRPRYVLLVGDASWDTKSATVDDTRYANWVDRQLLAPGRFRAQRIETYGESAPAGSRNLIPTFSFHTREGHAASDNGFVAVDGDDLLPDLAIGRLPVADRETLDGIIGKIRRYTTESRVGPWRRSVVWITNEWQFLQEHSRSIEADLRPRGLAATRIFPESEERSNDQHQASLTEALDAGQLLVHFAGHGGRYIWRTGPRDLGSKNYDLFTLDHVEALAPNDRLPVVFSVTCHSGPFDHPNADSIAEAFLRLPDRGAIAVVAAAWRTSAASVWLSREMMTEFTRGGRIGDAFLRAKRNLELDELIATYNLLGDPGVRLALPEGEVEVELTGGGVQRTVSLMWDEEGLTAQAIVDFVDPEGVVVHSEQQSFNTPQLELPWPENFDRGLVRAYVWSERENLDAIGTLIVESSTTESPAVVATGG